MDHKPEGHLASKPMSSLLSWAAFQSGPVNEWRSSFNGGGVKGMHTSDDKWLWKGRQPLSPLGHLSLCTEGVGEPFLEQHLALGFYDASRSSLEEIHPWTQ